MNTSDHRRVTGREGGRRVVIADPQGGEDHFHELKTTLRQVSEKKAKRR